jgi:hypothetical protein
MPGVWGVSGIFPEKSIKITFSEEKTSQPSASSYNNPLLVRFDSFTSKNVHLYT